MSFSPPLPTYSCPLPCSPSAGSRAGRKLTQQSNVRALALPSLSISARFCPSSLHRSAGRSGPRVCRGAGQVSWGAAGAALHPHSLPTSACPAWLQNNGEARHAPGSRARPLAPGRRAGLRQRGGDGAARGVSPMCGAMVPSNVGWARQRRALAPLGPGGRGFAPRQGWVSSTIPPLSPV